MYELTQEYTVEEEECTVPAQGAVVVVGQRYQRLWLSAGIWVSRYSDNSLPSESIPSYLKINFCEESILESFRPPAFSYIGIGIYIYIYVSPSLITFGSWGWMAMACLMNK